MLESAVRLCIDGRRQFALPKPSSGKNCGSSSIAPQPSGATLELKTCLLAGPSRPRYHECLAIPRLSWASAAGGNKGDSRPSVRRVSACRMEIHDAQAPSASCYPCRAACRHAQRRVRVWSDRLQRRVADRSLAGQHRQPAPRRICRHSAVRRSDPPGRNLGCVHPIAAGVAVPPALGRVHQARSFEL